VEGAISTTSAEPPPAAAIPAPTPDAKHAPHLTAERLSTFRGRSAQLASLTALHDRERKVRDIVGSSPQAIGPVVLSIHGKPGVGKSVLAQELARQLTPQYPDGILYANFGLGTGPRPAAEILSTFLLDLGWSEEEMPTGATDRAYLLRSLTAGRRYLFLFDAARHHGQVLQALPTESGCGVIVTSRRDLGPALNAPSQPPLDVPPVDEAVEILAAVAQMNWEAQPEQAIELVDLCGRLPVAIRSAAERVVIDGTDLRHVVDLLRSPEGRLLWLERGGRGVTELFQSEYERLTEIQQKALCLLTVVASTTFVPWVLSPAPGNRAIRSREHHGRARCRTTTRRCWP